MEVLRHPLHHADLLDSERCAAGGYSIGNPGLGGADHIHIAFHQHHAVVLHSRSLGAVQVIQHVGLFVNLGLRRIHILRLVFRIHGAPAECDDFS